MVKEVQVAGLQQFKALQHRDASAAGAVPVGVVEGVVREHPDGPSALGGRRTGTALDCEVARPCQAWHADTICSIWMLSYTHEIREALVAKCGVRCKSGF